MTASKLVLDRWTRREFNRRCSIPLKRDYLWQIETGVIRTFTLLEDGTVVNLGLRTINRAEINPSRNCRNSWHYQGYGHAIAQTIGERRRNSTLRSLFYSRARRTTFLAL
jgi:hypothetical protein